MNFPHVLREFVVLIPARLAGISSARSSVSDETECARVSIRNASFPSGGGADL